MNHADQPILPTDAASLERYAAALEAVPDYRVLRRLVVRTSFHQDRPEKLYRGVILDTESTGKDVKKDKLIELGMVLFEFCPDSGRVFNVLNTFNALEDPGMPIDPGASKVNGITDEMVKGHRINDEEVTRFLDNVELIIAHNSEFDRQIVEARFPLFANLPWGCSLRQVDWDAETISAHKQDYIAFRMGFCYEAHRAVADCQALLEILQRPLPTTGGLAFAQILANYHKQDFRIWALDAKYDKKDVMKNSGRGYRWGDGNDGKEKAWYVEVSEDNYDEEIAWLKENVYDGRQFRVAVDSIGPFNRFSGRAGARTTRFCS